MAARGIILEKTGTECIVLTPDGEFCRSRCRADARPGDEIEVVKPRPLARYLLLVASFLLMVMGWQMYRTVLPPVAAYVSLDINPGLELALDRSAAVIRLTPLDPEGKRLAENLDLRGLPVDQALGRLLEKAARLRFLDEKQSNAILVTVTPAGVEEPPVTTSEIARMVEREIRARNIPAKIVASPATVQERQQARKAGISPGRYKVQVGAETRGKQVPSQVIKKENLYQLEERVAIPLEDLLGGKNNGVVIRYEPQGWPLPTTGHERKSLLKGDAQQIQADDLNRRGSETAEERPHKDDNGKLDSSSTNCYDERENADAAPLAIKQKALDLLSNCYDKRENEGVAPGGRQTRQ